MTTRRLVVLLVEDDDAIRETFQDVLQDHGFQAEVAHKSMSVVQEIQAAPPDVLLIDLRLTFPGIGWAIVAALRADPALRSLPIVATSADALPTNEQLATLDELRVVLIKKPMLVEDLLVAIDDARTLASAPPPAEEG